MGRLGFHLAQRLIRTALDAIYMNFGLGSNRFSAVSYRDLEPESVFHGSDYRRSRRWETRRLMKVVKSWPWRAAAERGETELRLPS